MWAEALSGRHNVLYRRPIPSSMPSDAAAATAPPLRPVASQLGGRPTTCVVASDETKGRNEGSGTRERNRLATRGGRTRLRKRARQMAGAFAQRNYGPA